MRPVGGRGKDEWNTSTLKTVGPSPAASSIPCSHNRYLHGKDQADLTSYVLHVMAKRYRSLYKNFFSCIESLTCCEELWR